MSEKICNDLEILWISRFDYNKNWLLEAHSHNDFYQLIYCFEGKGTFLNQNKTTSNFNSPTIFFIPPKTTHGITNLSNGLKTIDIKFKIINRDFKAKCDALIPIRSTLFGQELLETLDKIREEGLEKFPFYQSYSRLLLGLILINLIRQNLIEEEFTAANKGIPYLNPDYSVEVTKIIAYIENNYSNKIISDDLEKVIHKSYRYISKLFIKEINMTPMVYCRNFRVLKAQELLQYSDKEIKEIYHEIGFKNIHQFSSVFTKIVGMPPGKWKSETRNGNQKDVYFNEEFKNTIRISKKK